MSPWFSLMLCATRAPHSGAGTQHKGPQMHRLPARTGSGSMLDSRDESHFLIRFTLMVRTHFDRDFSTQASQKVEQLVCCEAAEVPVHQMRYVGLCNTQNAGDFALFQLLLFQDFEDLKSYLRTSHELISVRSKAFCRDAVGVTTTTFLPSRTSSAVDA